MLIAFYLALMRPLKYSTKFWVPQNNEDRSQQEARVRDVQ